MKKIDYICIYKYNQTIVPMRVYLYTLITPSLLSSPTRKRAIQIVILRFIPYYFKVVSLNR